MKKTIKVAGIALLTLLALMVILPYAFRDKIKEVVITEGNKLLDAQFGFEDLDISLLRDFPQASVGLEGFWLKGTGAFEHDTLIEAGNLQAAVNLMSIFGDNGFDISKVLLADTRVKAIVLEDGQANWDVMKSDSTATEEEDTTSTATAFRIQLKKLSVENLNVIYDDRQSKMYAEVGGLDLTCSGDMSAEHTVLGLEALINRLTFKMNGIPFLSNARIRTNLNIDADLKNNRFTLKENTFDLNAIHTALDGWVALNPDNSMEMDMKLNTADINFKEILSLIPAIYAKDFEQLKANGSVSLNAFAQGTLAGDKQLPHFEVNMSVKDGSFRYPALPAGIESIQLTAGVKNPGGDLDATEAKVDNFSFSMMGNPFALTAAVKTPISDPDFSLSANGTLDLGQIKNVYPLENMNLNGVVTANMGLGGRLSYLDKGAYDRFTADGSISLRKMLLEMSGMPGIQIDQSTFSFSPQYLNLSETTVHIGDNDLTADCRFENYMAFALKGETLKGQLNVVSNHFNLNDFMTAEGDSTIAAADTTATTTEAGGVLVVPRNIDFNMNVDMNEILFDKMKISDLNGKLVIKDGTVDMKNLSLQTMGGNVVVNGAYSTAQSETNPSFNAAFAMNNLSFSQTFKELDMIQQMAPIFENLQGDFSGKMQIESQLDSVMSPVLNSMQGSGSLSTKDLNLSNVAILDKIADATNYAALKNISVKDMKLDFTIKDGRINTAPFDIKVGNMNLNLSGSTGLDQSIDYSGKLKLPESAGGLASLSTLDLKIGGNFTSPKITVDTKSMAKQAVSNVTNKALEEAGKKLGVDLSDANKQKEALVAAAQSAGNKLIEEAEKQKASLIEKAGNNAIKKIAAETAGNTLVKEAKKQAQNLLDEAEKKGNELIRKAEAGE